MAGDVGWREVEVEVWGCGSGPWGRTGVVGLFGRWGDGREICEG